MQWLYLDYVLGNNQSAKVRESRPGLCAETRGTISSDSKYSSYFSLLRVVIAWMYTP